MRAKIKIVIDTGMIILVLLQMAYHLVGDSLHEWLGIILFVLLILHNILDRNGIQDYSKASIPRFDFFTRLLICSYLPRFCVLLSVLFFFRQRYRSCLI